jgi:hypothetical protein
MSVIANLLSVTSTALHDENRAGGVVADALAHASHRSQSSQPSSADDQQVGLS